MACDPAAGPELLQPEASLLTADDFLDRGEEYHASMSKMCHDLSDPNTDIREYVDNLCLELWPQEVALNADNRTAVLQTILRSDFQLSTLNMSAGRINATVCMYSMSTLILMLFIVLDDLQVTASGVSRATCAFHMATIPLGALVGCASVLILRQSMLKNGWSAPKCRQVYIWYQIRTDTPSYPHTAHIH